MELHDVVPGLARLPCSPAGIERLGVLVNAYAVGDPGGPWLLFDTGPAGIAQLVRGACEQRFGAGVAPEAIVLSHGHFDHIGNALELAAFWKVEILVHPLELPFVTGKSNHPPVDPTIGGALALLTRIMPGRDPAGTDKLGGTYLGDAVGELPEDGSLPGMDGLRWLATPGHSPGHVSLFRDADAALIAGDAFATADFDSFVNFARQRERLAPAGSPFICDWDASRRSVEQLAALRPRVAVVGHGLPLTGPGTADEVARYAREFPVPRRGRYVAAPVRTDRNGIVELPPAPPDRLPRIAAAAGAGALVALATGLRGLRGRSS